MEIKKLQAQKTPFVEIDRDYIFSLIVKSLGVPEKYLKDKVFDIVRDGRFYSRLPSKIKKGKAFNEIRTLNIRKRR